MIASADTDLPPETSPGGPVRHADPLPAVRSATTSTRSAQLTGSSWTLLRNGGAPTLASGGQLGGSQAGMRVYYQPGPKGLALTARISAPLASRNGREGAVGVAIRHGNVGLIVEQRIALDGNSKSQPAVIAFGGVSGVPLTAGLRLDGYAQAGAVGVKAPALFIDGAVAVERTIMTEGRNSLSVGISAWGGAQPGASRVDIGPQLVARVAVAATTLRVSGEWRERVAGNASPTSGPAVSVGFDF